MLTHSEAGRWGRYRGYGRDSPHGRFGTGL